MKEIVIGFTGTRLGMSDNQKENVKAFLKSISDELKIQAVIHGGCIGSDEDFHKLCEGIPRVVLLGHPLMYPDDVSRRGDISGEDVVIQESKPFLVRNRNIVKKCNILLATPYDFKDKGGTWYTIAQARRRGKEVVIFNR